MSISGLFNIGRSALTANQTALAVTSNNIANANTLGYSREEVVLSVTRPESTASGYLGTGVSAVSIMRSFNRFIQMQLLGQQQNQGRSSAMDQTWGQVEALVNELQDTGLSTSLTDFFSAWNDVASAPESSTARTVLLQKASNLTRAASSIERSIVSTLGNTNSSITDDVKQINAIASQIAKYNTDITAAEAGQSTESANDLRDQRDEKLVELAKLVDYSTYEDPNGSITVTVGMRNLVSGSHVNTLSTTPNADGNPDLSLDGINITQNVQGGDISGLIAARDGIQSTTLTSLRKLVASISQQINSLHSTGFGLDGSTGNDFFNPLQLTTLNNTASATVSTTITNQTALTLDEYTINFTGGNYNVYNKATGALVTSGAYAAAGTTFVLPGISVTISGAVTASDSISVSPLTTAVSNFGVALTDPNSVAAASTAAGVPGDNATASAIAQLTDGAITNLGGSTFSDYYNGIVAAVGASRQATADVLTFDTNVLNQMQMQRDSVSGVSLDDEAANLIRFQRAYQAGAQVIKVADELLQTILNL
ncbi:MAG TPA: flagellar hook-associated protein FlgK [Nitrospirota bacterium]|nr:flagellar hook-associated protein FlgK [Nitrospirota bacterium]